MVRLMRQCAVVNQDHGKPVLKDGLKMGSGCASVLKTYSG